MLSGKAHMVCTDLGPTTAYNGVKKAILEHYHVNVHGEKPEMILSPFMDEGAGAHGMGNEGDERWLIPDDGVDRMVNKIAIEHFLNAWIATRNENLGRTQRHWKRWHKHTILPTKAPMAYLPMIGPLLRTLYLSSVIATLRNITATKIAEV